MKNLKLIIPLLVVAVAIFFLSSKKDMGASMENVYTNSVITATSSTLSVSVGNNNDVILDKNLDRRYAEITNVGGTIAYLAFINDTATTSALLAAIPSREFVVPLAANGGKYTINFDNLYRGRILATSTAAVEIRAFEVE